MNFALNQMCNTVYECEWLDYTYNIITIQMPYSPTNNSYITAVRNLPRNRYTLYIIRYNTIYTSIIPLPYPNNTKPTDSFDLYSIQSIFYAQTTFYQIIFGYICYSPSFIVFYLTSKAVKTIFTKVDIL